MGYYFKQSLFGYVYTFIMGFLSFGVYFIQNIYAECILNVIIIVFYLIIIGHMVFKEGEKAVRVRHANDIERAYIVKTGEPRPLKLKEEYKPYKGFLIGVFTCMPMLVGLFIHLILGLSLGEAYIGAGMVTNFFYFSFYWMYGMFLVGHGTGVGLTWAQDFILLYAFVIIVAVLGVEYILGAKKSQKQFDKIDDINKELYGDKQ